MTLLALSAVERPSNRVHRPLAWPDDEHQVDGLRMVAVAALNFKQSASAVKGIGDRRRRLILPAKGTVGLTTARNRDGGPRQARRHATLLQAHVFTVTKTRLILRPD